MKKTAIALGLAALALLAFAGSIPIVNDRAAEAVAERIQETALPEHTECIEAFARAGKLVGSGNGMQYLGGILIRSDLPLEALQAYYAQAVQGEWECIVERQTGRTLRFVEHGTVSLDTDADGDGYFIVYAWGSAASVFSTLDLRGH